jgi:hypothetical protein
LAAAERPDHDRREDGSGGADHEPGRHHPVGQRGVGHVPLEVGERVVLVGELGPAGEAERVAQAEHGRPQDHQRAPPAAAGRRPERQRRVRRAAGSEQLHPGQQPVGTGNEPSTDRPPRAEGGRATRERVGIDGMPVLPGDEHGGSGDQPEAVDDGGAADQVVGVLQLVEAHAALAELPLDQPDAVEVCPEAEQRDHGHDAQGHGCRRGQCAERAERP